MADSTTHLDTIAVGQSSKEVTANALFDAASPGTLYGRRSSTTTALTWGYYGGKFNNSAGTVVSVANGTLSLTPSATNYIQVDPASVTGVPTVNTSGFTLGFIQLYTVVTGASSVTSYTDHRAFMLASQTTAASSTAQANTVLAGPSAPQSPTSDTPTFRSLVELDLPTSIRALVTEQQPRLFLASPVAASPTGAPSYRAIQVVDLPQSIQDLVGGSSYDVGAFYPGEPTAGAILLRHNFARSVTFSGNFSGSVGSAEVAATAQTDFDVLKNGVSIGTIRFAASSSTATFITSGSPTESVSFASGDVLKVVAPLGSPSPAPDATLSDISFTLKGTRT